MDSDSGINREAPIAAPSLNLSVLNRIGDAAQTGGKEGTQRKNITQIHNPFSY